MTMNAADIVKQASGKFAIDVTTRYGFELQDYLKDSWDHGIKQVKVTVARPARAKSAKQERAYFALLNVMFGSGCHSRDVKDVAELHNSLKLQYRDLIPDYWILTNGSDIKDIAYEDDPEMDASSIIREAGMGYAWLPIPKSESRWTIEQSSLMIDLVINELELHEIMSRGDKWTAKYEEIRRGMEGA